MTLSRKSVSGTGRRTRGPAAAIPGGEGQADKAQIHSGESEGRQRGCERAEGVLSPSGKIQVY